ncbi:hypothetical protein FACS1894140_2330 [Spirochaetia bacterium]|nr:hypothetical protein FACS1894140_2330 [Spirochaetia bacterium]
MLVFFAVYFFLKVRAKEKIALFEILGAVGFLAGLAIVLLSPGSHYRGTTVELAKQYNSIVWFCRQVFLAAWRFFESGFVPAGLAVAAGLELRRQGKKIDRFAVLYGILGFTAFFSMIVSPEFPPRTSFSGVVFFCVMLLYLASKLTISEQIKKNIPAVYAVALIAFSFSFADAAKDILEIHTKWKHRIEYIESQKKKGNLDIEITEPIPTSTRLGNKYAARANDITTNANRWPNTSVARYFGINSIRGIDNGDEIW